MRQSSQYRREQNSPKVSITLLYQDGDADLFLRFRFSARYGGVSFSAGSKVSGARSSGFFPRSICVLVATNLSYQYKRLYSSQIPI